MDWATHEDGTTDAATSGVDFTAASGTLNFAIGETEKTVTVILLDDYMDENHEKFNVVLSNPVSLTLGTGAATGTILDDELAFAVFFVSPDRDSVEEGEDIVLKIKRLFPQDPGEQVVTVGEDCTGGNITRCFTDEPTARPGECSSNRRRQSHRGWRHAPGDSSDHGYLSSLAPSTHTSPFRRSTTRPSSPTVRPRHKS